MSDADVIRRVPLEIIGEGRMDLIDEIYAPNYVEHDLHPGIPQGRDGLRTFFPALRAAFPDLKCVIIHEMHGEKHLVHLRMSGTMTGDFPMMPGTGKFATWDEMHLSAMANGKITEHWAVIDQLGMLQQLGVIAPPPGA